MNSTPLHRQHCGYIVIWSGYCYNHMFELSMMRSVRSSLDFFNPSLAIDLSYFNHLFTRLHLANMNDYFYMTFWGISPFIYYLNQTPLLLLHSLWYKYPRMGLHEKNQIRFCCLCGGKDQFRNRKYCRIMHLYEKISINTAFPHIRHKQAHPNINL